MKKYMILLLMVIAAVAFFTGCDKGDDQSTSTPQPAASSDAQTATDVTTNTICPVMGGPVDKNIFVEYKGKKVYLCCQDCVNMFKAAPEKYLAKLPQFNPDITNDAAAQAAATADSMKDSMANMMKMPENTICPVMGGPVDKKFFTEYKGKKVYFCCDGCDDIFLKDPEKYLSKLPQFGGKETK